MGERAWEVPQGQFVVAWNASGSLAGAVERIKVRARGHVPRWAVMARAGGLRKGGVKLKVLRVKTAA
jgi:hypothetical protein